jgi:hypothetical protein
MNVCGFYALYNALRDPQQRMKFAAGNLECPHASFVELIKDFSDNRYEDRIRKDGYNSSDYRRYLDHLKNKKWIKEYTWLRTKKDWTPSKHLCARELKTDIYLLCGHATFGKSRRKSIKPNLTKAEKAARAIKPLKGLQQKIEACAAYNKWSECVKGAKWSHGISIGAAENGCYYVYDNSRMNRYVLQAEHLTNLSWSINRVFAAYRFNIVV